MQMSILSELNQINTMKKKRNLPGVFHPEMTKKQFKSTNYIQHKTTNCQLTQYRIKYLIYANIGLFIYQ